MRYTTALLFHGPGAREEALRVLPQVGRPVSSPIGDEGLKVEDARSIIKFLRDQPLGDQEGCVLVGPMDRAEQKSTDVLLKAIEEFDPEGVRPVLWAYDLGSVSNTIKSRCIHRWCPNAPDNAEDEERVKLAFDVVDASLAKDRPRIIELLRDTKGNEAAELIEACAQALVIDPSALVGARYDLWSRLRRLARFRYVGRTELLAAFIGGVCPG